MPDHVDRYFDERIETLPPELLRKLQDHRLRWQFRRCWDGSEWYRARFAAAGLTPESFGGRVDLDRIPLLTVAELADVNSAVWQVAPSGWIMATSRQDGFTDRHLAHGDLVHEEDRYARSRWSVGLARMPRASLPSALIDQIGEPTYQRMGPPERPSWSVADALHATATLPAAAPEDPRPRLVYKLDLPFVGTSLAYECRTRTGLHWVDDHLLAEVIDPETSQTARGESPGELIVTDLVREASPLVRLRTGLEVRVTHEPCACGRTSGRVLSARPLP